MLTAEEWKERFDYAHSHTKEEFMQRFGLSAGATNRLYTTYRIRTAKKHKTDELDADEVRLYMKDHTIKEGAEHYGVGKFAFYSFLQLNCISPSRGQKLPALAKDVKRLWKEGKRCSEIARELGRSRQYIHQILKTVKGLDNEEKQDSDC